MSAGQAVRDHRDQILQVASHYGASNVRVFGSVARGEDTADSDIDLLVAFEPGRSLLDHAGMKLALEELLGRPVDIATDSGLRRKYLDRVLAEAVAL